MVKLKWYFNLNFNFTFDLFCFQDNKPFLGSVPHSNGPCDITDYGSFFIFKSREGYDFAQNCLTTFQCESNSRAILRIEECSIQFPRSGVPVIEIAKSSKEIININTPDNHINMGPYQCPVGSGVKLLTSAYDYINITTYEDEPSKEDSNHGKNTFKLQLECFG